MTHTYAPGSTLSVQDVADLIDHALLKPELTPAEVEQSCRELAAQVCRLVDGLPLAVELAEDLGMTLVGFNRGTSLNVYTGRHRVR